MSNNLPRKRILKELVIDRIAAVDRPAQEGALATILKRADPTMESDMHSLDQLEVDVMRLEKQIGELNKPPKKSQRGKHADLEDISEDDDVDEEDDESDASVNKRHRFVALAENLANEEGVPMAEALTRARKQYPDLYASYQECGMQKSYDALVDAEIRKGCSPNVAAQRVAMIHPDAARDSIAKREGDVAKFMEAVGVYQAEHGCDRTVAMSEVRKRNPRAFGRFQNV